MSVPRTARHRRLWVRLLPAAALLPNLLGCSDHCLKERKETGRLLERARGAQAPIYSPETFKIAADLAARGETECRIQQSRFVLARDYGAADRLHASSRKESKSAAREAAMNRGLFRQEAFNAQLRAAQSVEDARVALVRARKLAGDASTLPLLDSLRRLQRALEDLQARTDRGDFLGAKDLAERIQSQAIRLQAEANNRALAPRGR